MPALTAEKSNQIWVMRRETSSFMYIDESVRATQMVANGESTKSVNVGAAELVSINDVVSIVEDIAGIQLKREYGCRRPQGRMDSPALVRLPLIPVDVTAVTPEWVNGRSSLRGQAGKFLLGI